MIPAYKLKNLTKAFGPRTALNIPYLTISPKSIYALLGPNGAGKSTLLNILGFLDHPSSGELQYQQKKVRFIESELKALRRQVVMVEQHPILFTTTVYKNLEFGLKIRKLSKKNRERQIHEALELVGMRDFAAAKAPQLSGGETQRVALARGLVLTPKVFLCDEPTASVDIENQAIILNILKEINETKKMSIVFTTHDRSQAAKIAHHTMVLNHGKLVDESYDNIFSGLISHIKNDAYQCHLHPKISLNLHHPDMISPQARSKVSIDSKQIKILPRSDKYPNKNVVSGRVQQVLAENRGIRVVIQAAIGLNLFMAEDEYQNNPILVGDDVNCFIPPGAIRMLDKP